MKLLFILAILLILGGVNGDVHVDDTEKIISGMMMDKQGDIGSHVSEFDPKQSSPNIRDDTSCDICRFCDGVLFIPPVCWP
ncbi:hypothetical protein Pmar_PMAR011408, partial [Perkinsus marinus ATCC 50983]